MSFIIGMVIVVAFAALYIWAIRWEEKRTAAKKKEPEHFEVPKYNAIYKDKK